MDSGPAPKKILFILGTRPEAIKFAPLIHKTSEDSHFQSIVCFTGQHKEMLYQTAGFFKITAEYDLALMVPNQSLAEFVSKALIQIFTIIEKVKPDLIFVQGDTSTVLAASLSAYYHKTKIAHLEAGLRSWDKYNPFPEEMNRTICSRLADFHFTPTQLAQQNLKSEGIDKGVYVVGNTVIDALFLCLDLIKKQGEESYFNHFQNLDFNKKIILITCHRRENFGQPLLNILAALKKFALENSEIQLVYPVHLNPNVYHIVHRELNGIANIHLMPPLEYPFLIWLMNKSYAVVTDSGGMQEEAPSLGKPVLVLREVTERTESIEAGTAILVGSDQEKIEFHLNRLCADADYYNGFIKNSNPYGDGHTSEKILELLKAFL